MISYINNKIISTVDSFDHLKKKNINYIDHFKQASYLSYKLVYTGVTTFIHGAYPPLFEDSILVLMNEINKKCDKKDIDK